MAINLEAATQEITLFHNYSNQRKIERCKTILENLSWDCPTSIKLQYHASQDLSFDIFIDGKKVSNIIPVVDTPEQIAFNIKRKIKDLKLIKPESKKIPSMSWAETIKKNGFGTLSTNL